jgi:hypothetical protein
MPKNLALKKQAPFSWSHSIPGVTERKKPRYKERKRCKLLVLLHSSINRRNQNICKKNAEYALKFGALYQYMSMLYREICRIVILK